MKLHLTSAYSHHPRLDRLKHLASIDRIGRHQVTDVAADADAILFVENTHYGDYLFRGLREHELVRRYGDKVFMYNEADKPVHTLPGLYCSMPFQHYDASRHIGFPYLLKNPNDVVPTIHSGEFERKYLYSFVGAMSHRIRKQVMALPAEGQYLMDTSNYSIWDCTDEERRIEGQKFAHAMAHSHFILCPHGIGCASFRPFEAMQAARAPVIISDNWVPTPQIDWSFAVFVPERDIEQIPDILHSIKDEALDRGQAARAAWERVYADEVLFDTAAQGIHRLLKATEIAHRPAPLERLRGMVVNGEVLALQAARQVRSSLRSQSVQG